MRWLGPYRNTFVIIVVIGLALRLPGLMGDLGLEEIGSLETGDNHLLTGLWLRLLGPLAPSPLYRLPSLVAGVATVVMAAWVARRDGETAAIVTALLFAVSYPLVYYASEARGYAPVVFFTLAAWYCLREYADRLSRVHLLGFWTCCGLGILSHATFIEFFLAGVVWCGTHLRHSRGSLRGATRGAAIAFALPAPFLVACYWFAPRGTGVAVGLESLPEMVATQTLSLLLGGPAAGVGMWIVGLLAAAMALGSVVMMWRRTDDRWLVYGLAGLALPLLLWLARHADSLSPRNLLVPGAFALLAIGDLVARWMVKPAPARVAGALVMTVACSGSIVHVLELGELGRGGFEGAVQRIAPQPGMAPSVASIGVFSQRDERTEMLIHYYASRLPWPTGLSYVTERSYPVGGVDWMISEHIQGGDEDPPQDVVADFYGHQFLFEREYRSSVLTGISWRLYRRLTR